MSPARLAGLTLGLALEIGAALFQRFVVRPLPDRTQDLRIPGLDGPAEVRWDSFGVPHVYAHSLRDLFSVQGYLHGQDRLWQLELNRRVGSGRLSEVFGERTLEADRFLRRVGLRRAAAAEMAQLNDETAGLLAAYCGGVNTYLERHRNRLPLEFTLLRHRPEPWQPLDTLQWAKLMGWGLALNWDAELFRDHFRSLLGDDGAKALEHAYPPDHPLTTSPAPAPPAAGLADDDPLLASAFLRGGFSNAWAVAGDRSAWGSPLLANDPHLNPQVPSPYYEMHLECPGFRVAGATLPGAPGIVVGHNADVAWGITASLLDTQDVFVEQFDADAPTRYRIPSGWAEASFVDEAIDVRGGGKVMERVALTRHGPVVLRDRRDPLRAFALCSTVLEPDGLIAAGLAIARAEDLNGLRRALEGWSAPSVNFVMADRHGATGYQLVGRAPHRAEGTGVLPVPGWDGAGDWQGFLPFERLPHVVAPAGGVVVSANHKPDAEAADRPLVGEWADGYRAQRILDCLSRQERHTASSFAATHRDAVSLAARALQDLLRDVVPRGPLAQRLWQDFLGWDGVVGEDSREAALYHAVRRALYRLLLAPALGAAVDDFFGLQVHPLGTSSAYQFRGSSFLLAQLGGVKRAATGPEAMSALVTAAFETAHADLVQRLGPNEARWAWGRIHRVTLRHVLGRGPLLGRLFNRGPYPVRGDADTPHQASFSLREPYEATRWLPTLRFIADTGDWDRSLMVHVPGQSGQVGDAHFDDQIALWRRGEYHAMPFSRHAVEAATVSVQRLLSS